ncbi:MAG: DMT family transporter [Armatimonadota bacterium]|nr:DMT family transporter [Armatimonadota bacterium]MDR7421981.1 DMT family transporter [Armatimonadota bacterium]MDR7455555.1 DMT family transporter [Armatimonadota bacterium]MDR7456948.1 DMT family transporter [Armatimonadota bacterium]MDR7496471.1 DMT family transporter [Armatimonadota bacterium]
MIGELAALASALAFGFSTILARRFMGEVAPEAGVLVSIVVNVTVFVGLSVLAATGGQLALLRLEAVALFVAGGLAGTLVGRNLSYQSIGRIGASLSVTIRLSSAVFTLLIGYLVLREFPRASQLWGTAAVLLGLWVSLRPAAAPAGRGPADPRGVLLALASAVAFAVGDVARRAGLAITPVPVFGAAVGASVALGAHLLWGRVHRAARWPSRAVLLRGDVAGSALLNTAAILCLYVGLRHAPAAIVSVLYNLQVLVVLVAGPIVLKSREPLSGWVAAGAALALAGTTLILAG